MWGWFSNSSGEYQSVRSTSSSSEGSSADEASSSTSNSFQIKPAEAAKNTASNTTTSSSPTSGGIGGIMSTSIDKMKGFLGIAPEVPPEEKTFTQEFDEMMTLTRTQRLYGFAFTFVLGWVISLLSLIAVPQIVIHPEKFAILYTSGNIISLCSTAFLWGPCQQLKDMFKPVRIVATIVYILSMALTLFCAFGLRMMLPVILSIIVQMCAMVWYCASYIPYGHDILRSCMGTCCSSMLS